MSDPAPTDDPSGPDAPSWAGRVLVLVRREALASIVPSQVMAPLGQHPPASRPRLGLLVPLGQLVRPRWRRQLLAVRDRAGDEFGIATDLLPSPPSRLMSLWDEARVVARWVRRRTPRGPVVLHCRGPEATHVALAVRERLPRVRVLYDARGAVAEEFVQRLELEHGTVPADRLAAVRQSEHAAYARADAVLGVSAALLEHLARRSPGSSDLSDRPTAVVPCCPDLSRFDASAAVRDAARERLGYAPTDRVLAYCGSAVWYQRPEWVVRVAAAACDRDARVRLLVLSQSPDRFAALAREAGIADGRVRAISLPSGEVPRVLPAADAGLLLRDQTIVNRVASPVKFAEYLAAGVPVAISPAVGDCSALVRAGRLGVVLDPAADDPGVGPLVDLMATADPAVRDRCRRAAETHYRWDRHLPTVAAVYERLTR